MRSQFAILTTNYYKYGVNGRPPFNILDHATNFVQNGTISKPTMHILVFENGKN